MADIHIRDVDPEIIRKVEQRAVRHGRSLDAEYRSILAEVVGAPAPRWQDVAERLRRETAHIKHTPAEVLVRETRDEN